MTAALRKDAAVSRSASDQIRTSVREPAPPVRLEVTADDVKTLHRRIPELVGRVRQQLSSSPDSPRRDLVVDLFAVRPSPAVAPLLFLVHLLCRLVGDGKIDIIGVTPALVGALTAFELPNNATVVDVRGRRWPG
jgi:hypothetical protein